MESRGVSVLLVLAGLAGGAVASGDALAAQCGKAAWYDLDGQTASGERSSGSALAAAHRTLPFGTKVRVDNLANGRSVVVRINDRGPFVGGRVIDVTRAAAEKLGMINSGIAKVRVSVVDGNARLDGSCEDPAPRVITADAVAKDASRNTPAPGTRPATTADGSVSDEVAAATPSPNESKPPAAGSGKVLVATVQYDEGTGDAAAVPTRQRSASPAAGFTEEQQLDDLEDGKIVAAADVAVDIPLPRPRPPIFDDAPPTFNRTLALRFLDAFAPNDSGMELTVPLGYAPTTPRGAIITE
ncbi:MAG: septal ring lytic transglycosylase RlpA family protein [Bauldia sp.]|nr:septal ring lytic transglycosylase RlpA family protein [Bauldia sp.]